ncbi:MAG: MFS transporter [Dehalococcoidia bacterium]
MEACPSRTASGVVENVTVPLALALGATNLQVGLLGAFPKLLAALLQLFTPRLMVLFGGSRRVLYRSAAAGAIAYFAMVLVPLMPEPTRVWGLILLAAVGLVFVELPNPAWTSWFSSQMPANRRGRYLALRSSLASITSMGAIIATGVFLDAFAGRVFLGFGVALAAAGLMRVASAGIFYGVHEQPRATPRAEERDLARFLRAMSHPNLRRMLFYSFGLQIGGTISGAYFTAYQLQVLEFSYSGLLWPTIIATASGIVGLQVWGRMGDRSGNLLPIRSAAIGIALLPILWIWVQEPFHVALINVAGGFLWTGYFLCSGNYLSELALPEDRASYAAYLTAFNGVASFTGALIGAGLLAVIPAAGAGAFFALFIVSAIIRLGAALAFLPKMTDVR